MNDTEKLYIVIPAYNEAENISSVIHAWCKYVIHGGGVYA